MEYWEERSKPKEKSNKANAVLFARRIHKTILKSRDCLLGVAHMVSFDPIVQLWRRVEQAGGAERRKGLEGDNGGDNDGGSKCH
jgi:hypothetical protein